MSAGYALKMLQNDNWCDVRKNDWILQGMTVWTSRMQWCILHHHITVPYVAFHVQLRPWMSMQTWKVRHVTLCRGLLHGYGSCFWKFYEFLWLDARMTHLWDYLYWYTYLWNHSGHEVADKLHVMCGLWTHDWGRCSVCDTVIHPFWLFEVFHSWG